MKSIVAGFVALGLLAGIHPAWPADTSGNPVRDGAPVCDIARPPAPRLWVASRRTLKVATFNLLHSDTDESDRSLQARLPLEAQAIAGADVDVVGVQEAARNENLDRANEYPQKHGFVVMRLAELLARLTGQPWEWCWSLSNPHVPGTPDVNPGGGNPLDDQAAATGNTPDPGDFREGLGILTRFHIDRARFRRMLPRSYEAAACTDGDPFCSLAAAFDSRQVLWAHLVSPGGSVDVFTTHIAHGLTPLSDATKLLQVRQALSTIGEWATPDPFPDFLLGDFNSTHDTDRYRAVVNAGFVDTYRAAGGLECTKPGGPGCTGNPPSGQESYTKTNSRAMGERIDYVFARPPAGCAFRSLRSNVIGNEPAKLADGRWVWPSDHLGVASVVRCR